jgi:transcriptional regulator with XRE-family HTH domain
MSASKVGELVERARAAAGLSQRTLAECSGVSQSTLSRIITGHREATMPEIVAIAWATGHTVAQLTGTETVADRVQYAARATNGASMESLRQTLLHYLELDDYLDDQAIPATVSPALAAGER